MGNDNSSAINFGPFQDTDFECTITGTMQAPVSFPFLPRRSDLVTFSCTMRSPGTERPRPECTTRSSVILIRPDLVAVGLMERLHGMLKQLQPPLDQDSYQKLCQIVPKCLSLPDLCAQHGHEDPRLFPHPIKPSRLILTLTWGQT